MNSKIACTVIGDAMIDIIFSLSNKQDLEYLLHGGATSVKSTISLGGTANVAVGISRLGCQSAFIGKVGADCFGKYLESDLKINNVKDCLAVSNNHNTGMVFDIVLPNKERFFIVDRGANADLGEEDVDFDLCLNSCYLYISGYSFQDKKTSQTVHKVVKEMSSAGVSIVFNPATPNISKRYKDEFINMIKNYIDILVLNEKEGKELISGTNEEILDGLLSYGVKKVALTMGEKGSIIATPNERYRINVHPVEVVDTTGAGDAYAAAFIVGTVKGWSEEKVGEFASRVAGEIVGKIGAR